MPEDQRETMERPFFSLSQRKRLKPIDYLSPDGKITVHVSANSEYGLATIYDLDILIYWASVLIKHKRRGSNDIPQALHIVPYDMLKTLKRDAAAGPTNFWATRSTGFNRRPSGPTSDPEMLSKRHSPGSTATARSGIVQAIFAACELPWQNGSTTVC